VSADKLAPQLPKPEVLLFDWDGTLVDSHPVLAKAMNITLAAFDKEPWTFKQWQDWLGASARDAFPQVFGDDWEEARKKYYGAYADAHMDALALIPYADTLIAALKPAPLKLGVVTNKSGPFLLKEIDKLGWGDHFSALVGAGDAARDKPAPDPALKAIDHLRHGGGGTVWFIGDNAVDVACGRAAGCTTILVGDSPSEPEPDHRVTSLDSLQTLIFSALNPI